MAEKVVFNRFMSLVTLRRSTEVEWYDDIALELTFYGYDFSIGSVYALEGRRFDKPYCIGSETIVDVPV